MTAEPDLQRRLTRLSSRVSELDSRVTIFEPGNASSVPSVEELQDAGEELEESPKRSRKRIKLDSETAIADIEDGMYVQSPTRSSSQRVVKAKIKVMHEEEGSNPKSETSGSPKGKGTTSPSKPKSPSKSKPIPQSLANPHPAPPKWRETYDTIKSMRSQFIAPVDTMGCAEAQTGEIEPRVICLSLPIQISFNVIVLQNRRYASLVSLMLSSQTKDEVTYTAIANLRAAFGGSISLEAMIEADDKVIAAAISKVGFWKKKTGFVITFDSMLPILKYILGKLSQASCH
jgi:endonuclease-3